MRPADGRLSAHARNKLLNGVEDYDDGRGRPESSTVDGISTDAV